jgi:hypothetical protein
MHNRELLKEKWCPGDKVEIWIEVDEKWYAGSGLF